MDYAIYDTITGKIDGWYSDEAAPEKIIQDAENNGWAPAGRLQVIGATKAFGVPNGRWMRLSELGISESVPA